MTKQEPETVKDCHYPWTWMHVAADGSVKPCCFATGELGNLFVEPDVDTIWNGPIAVELRAFIKLDQVHPVCRGAICKFVKNTEQAAAERMFF